MLEGCAALAPKQVAARTYDLVRRQLATVAPTARIVMLTAYDNAGNLRRCLEAGAASVLLKGTLDLDLVQALRDIRHGRMVIDGSVARPVRRT